MVSSQPRLGRFLSRAILLASISANLGLAVGLIGLLASTAATVSTTGLAADQRPWVILLIAASTLALVGLLVLDMTAWLFGTAQIPGWARRAWWGDRIEPPLLVVAAVSGPRHATRIAIALLAVGLPLAILAAPLQGLLLGWLLNNRQVLSPAEATFVLAEVAAGILWTGYLVMRNRRRADNVTARSMDIEAGSSARSAVSTSRYEEWTHVNITGVSSSAVAPRWVLFTAGASVGSIAVAVALLRATTAGGLLLALGGLLLLLLFVRAWLVITAKAHRYLSSRGDLSDVIRLLMIATVFVAVPLVGLLVVGASLLMLNTD